MATRSEFLEQLAAEGAATGLAFIADCGDDDVGGTEAGGGGTDSGGGGGSCSSVISSNHSHTINVTAAHVAAATARTYDIQVGITHPHTVDVSAGDFGLIASAGSVTVTSSSDSGHTHMVMITCS